MSHSEFMRRVIGHQKREEMIWHRWRLGICYSVNIHIAKGSKMTPQDVIELPMDGGKENGIDASVKEQLKKFMSNG
jgi:hypothetical protein